MPKGVKIAGLVVGGVLVLVGIVVGAVYAMSSGDFNETYDVNPPPMQVSAAGTNGEMAEWGEHLHHIRGCADCHGEDAGGGPLTEDAALAVLYATNLTSGEGGAAARYSDQDWDRSVRHGVGPDMKPLMFMPAHEFWPLSDHDLASLIAFYRATPPVDNTFPEPAIGPLGRVLYVTGQLPLIPARLVDHDAQRPPAPAMGPTVAYGEYLATGCTGCHGPNLSGGKIVGGDPNWPPAKNITPHDETGIGTWSFEGFDRALRQGIRPDGSEINPVMPIQATSHFTDVEMEAIYAYLMSLEPRMYGSR